MRNTIAKVLEQVREGQSSFHIEEPQRLYASGRTLPRSSTECLYGVRTMDWALF